MLAGNLRGILWMILGMAAFATLDTLLKLLAGAIPTGQLIALQGLGGALVFALLGLRVDARDWVARFRHPAVLARNFCEAMAAACFVLALSSAPLSIVAAIIQANPILVTLGAAIWLREPVGLHRWSAIFVGLCGVLLVIRPWAADFDPASLYAVAGVIFLSARDLLVRWIPDGIPTIQLGTMAMASLVIAGVIIHVVPGTAFYVPDGRQTSYLVLSVFALALGFVGTTAAMRTAVDISAVTPFRYSRLPFAMILAAIFFGESPDALTYVGAAIIVASGLYTLWREQRRRAA
jgi:drug/metabolite transporter (DMT)-like permease